MRAFITGITGFGGTHLAEHLLACGDTVCGCSRQGSWRRDVPAELPVRTELIAWDVGQTIPSTARQFLIDFHPECVFHLSALSVPADCGQEQPTPEAVSTNIDGTRAVVDLVQSLPSRPRLLLVSTCYVYAAVDPGQPQVCESAPLGPTGGYGKSKLHAEKVLMKAVREAGIYGVIARVFQHSGPRQSPRMVIPQWSRQFIRGDDPVQVINLDTRLDLSDVRDTVRAYRRLIESGEPGQAYNVGSGRCVRTGDILEQLRSMYDPHRSVVECSPGRRQHPIADIGRIRDQTGWEPSIPLETTLVDTLAYWQQQEQMEGVIEEGTQTRPASRTCSPAGDRSAG